MIDFGKVYIIPDKNEIEPYMKLCQEYGMHFEYNDFFIPSDLEREGFIQETIDFYKAIPKLPADNILHGVFLDMNISSSDPKIREISESRIRESVSIADKLGAKAVILHTNFIPNFKDEQYVNGWIEDNACFIDKLLDEYPHMELYMENMFDMSYELIHRLAKRLLGENGKDGVLTVQKAERFGICLDYAHIHVFGKENSPEQWVETLAPYIKHVHINNNDLVEDSHAALSEGSIDYSIFFSLYEKYMPNATILLEMLGIDKIEKSLTCIKKMSIKIIR